MELRNHQLQKSQELVTILRKYSICYLAGQVRSGKTGTALNCAELFGAKKILVVTKKKAIGDIQKQHNDFGFTYDLHIINYESVHKVGDTDFDLIIYDEAHSLSAYPKPSKATKQCRAMFYEIPCILMSGTPATESYSQFYHQFYVSKFSPFASSTNFYKWAKVFVEVKQRRLATHTINDYSGAKTEQIDIILNPYKVVMTQQDAGFEVKINESKIYVKLPSLLKNLSKQLMRDKAIEGKSGVIMGETPAKLQSKVHQILNGHCIIEKDDGTTFKKVFSTYKADFIKERFKGQKVAIMYYYQNELDMLLDVFKDGITNDLEEFNTSNKNLAIQQSSTEGMNLSKADALVYFNFGFSGKNYIQSRDRLTVKGRDSNDVYFILEEGGINDKILKRVKEKKDYNSASFRKDFLF